jgi:CopG family nickel-responsive transcriptional regulator
MKTGCLLRRFSVSMDQDLVCQLDAMTRARGYANRSQAMADMVRSQLVDHYAESDLRDIAGTITLVYDHHKRDLQARLTDIQHDHEGLIISVLHVHLDHQTCLEVLVVHGRADVVKKMADGLMAIKGVQHGKLTVTTTGTEFSG